MKGPAAVQVVQGILIENQEYITQWGENPVYSCIYSENPTVRIVLDIAVQLQI